MTRASSRLPGWAANLLLAAGAMLFTLGMLEIGVRLFVDVQELAPIGVHDVDPTLPIRFLPNHQRTYETSEFRYTVRFNRFGRRDDAWSRDTIEDPKNLLFIGDSFVLGNGVEHEAAIPTRLERLMAERGHPREVFNFGMPAGDPTTYLELFEHAVESGFAARTVVIGAFVGNDFYPYILDPEPPAPAAERTPEVSSNRPRSELFRFLKRRLSTSARVVGWVLSVGNLIGVNVYDTTGSYIFLRNPSPAQKATFERILALFGRIQERAVEEGRRLRVVIFPNRIQVENRADLTNRIFDAALPNARFLEYCDMRGIECLDLLPVLSSRYESDRKPLYFPIDRHLNERGTRLAAEAIDAFLQETGALR